jgi:hypothetical protein
MQLASNFTNFFEKLIGLIGQLSDSFPQFGEIANLFKDCGFERMKRHLVNINGHLLQFFQDVAAIFTTPQGSN